MDSTDHPGTTHTHREGQTTMTDMTPEQRERRRASKRRYAQSLPAGYRARQQRRYVESIDAFAIVPPRTPWSHDEDETILSWSGTLVDLALHLGRTYYSTGKRRTKLLDRLAAED